MPPVVLTTEEIRWLQHWVSRDERIETVELTERDDGALAVFAHDKVGAPIRTETLRTGPLSL